MKYKLLAIFSFTYFYSNAQNFNLPESNQPQQTIAKMGVNKLNPPTNFFVNGSNGYSIHEVILSGASPSFSIEGVSIVAIKKANSTTNINFEMTGAVEGQRVLVIPLESAFQLINCAGLDKSLLRDTAQEFVFYKDKWYKIAKDI